MCLPLIPSFELNTIHSFPRHYVINAIPFIYKFWFIPFWYYDSFLKSSWLPDLWLKSYVTLPLLHCWNLFFSKLFSKKREPKVSLSNVRFSSSWSLWCLFMIKLYDWMSFFDPLTVFSLLSALLTLTLIFKALMNSAFWKAVLKKGRCLLQSKKSIRNFKICHCLFPDNKK